MQDIDISTMSAKDLKALARAGVLQELIAGRKNDVGTGVPFMHPAYNTTPNQPNDGGIFTQPGIRPEMFSTLAQPQGLAAFLNPEPNNIAEERVSLLTGQTDGSGTNPTDFCGEPVTPGDLKVCTQFYTYGKLHLGSKKIEINTAGIRANRAVTPERVILNRAMTDPLIPDLLQDPNVDFMSEDAQAMYELGTMARRSISQVLTNGNPATASASARPGWIKEFSGTDLLIKTGHVDMTSGNACPAADSVTPTWGADIASTVEGSTFIQRVTELVLGFRYLADQLGMGSDGMTWAFRTRPDAWFAITSIWACNYATSYCTDGTAGMPVGRTATEINNFRIDMYNGRYLLIEGIRYPVILDDGMPIGAPGGNFRSADLEFIPLAWNGRSLLKFEFVPMDNPTQTRLRGHFGNEAVVTNNGMYAIYWERTKACVQWILDAMFRMWLETPFLAFKLQDIHYIANIAYRSPYPGVTGHLNGGSVSFAVNN